MSDEAFGVYENLFNLIHDLVDGQIKHLSDEDREEVRCRLTNEFRFWERRSHD